MVLFGLRDVGSVNACLPVITLLKDRGIPVSVYAEGSARERLKDKFGFIPECKIGHLLNSVRPSLVIVTVATKGGSIPIDLNNEAKQRNLPTVLVEDGWAGHSASEWKVLPDGACVTDEFAKSLILKSWSSYSESRIHITGSPIFDKFVNVQTEAVKHQLRQVLHIYENWPIIFFPGSGQIWGMVQAVSMLVEALNNLDIPTYLILRDHPAISFARATEYRQALKDLRMGTVVDSSKLTSDEVNAGSDIVVGTFSSMTVEACYLRKPVLTIWTPEIRQSFLEATNNILAEWPITNLGASLKAESIGEIKICLQKILAGDTAAMTGAQQKHFKADGFNSKRVAKAILNYYRC